MPSPSPLLMALSIVVSAPAVLIGQLLRRGDTALAVQVLFVEVLIIALAAGIFQARRQSE